MQYYVMLVAVSEAAKNMGQAPGQTGPEQYVFGMEQEYGVVIVPRLLPDVEPPGQYMNKGQLLRAAFSDKERRYPKGISEFNTYLSNGGRMYLDVGDHPEYGTPEETSIDGVVARHFDGDKVIAWMLKGLCDRGLADEYRVYRRLIDSLTGENWGLHVSHMVDSADFVDDHGYWDEGKLDLLAVHNATIGVVTGAGYVNSDGVFHITQKGSRVTEDFSITTTKTKSVVNLRRESLCPTDEHQRVHTVAGDSSHSPWAMKIQVGSIGMVLKLIASGETSQSTGLISDMPLNELMRFVSSDITLRKTFDFGPNKKMRAIDVQREIHKRCGKLTNLNKEERAVLQHWGTLLDMLDVAPMDMDTAEAGVPWAAKLQELSERVPDHAESIAIDKGRLVYQNEKALKKAMGVDLNFDLAEIHRRRKDPKPGEDEWLTGGGYGVRWRKNQWKGHLKTTEKDVTLTTPPNTTRAIIRGAAVIKAASLSTSKKSKISIDWGKVANGPNGISLGQPHQPDRTMIKTIKRFIGNPPNGNL